MYFVSCKMSYPLYRTIEEANVDSGELQTRGRNVNTGKIQVAC